MGSCNTQVWFDILIIKTILKGIIYLFSDNNSDYGLNADNRNAKNKILTNLYLKQLRRIIKTVFALRI